MNLVNDRLLVSPHPSGPATMRAKSSRLIAFRTRQNTPGQVQLSLAEFTGDSGLSLSAGSRQDKV
jgi:hypothetical protein